MRKGKVRKAVEVVGVVVLRNGSNFGGDEIWELDFQLENLF